MKTPKKIGDFGTTLCDRKAYNGEEWKEKCGIKYFINTFSLLTVYLVVLPIPN